ncbi:hypothetical protein LEP1GSC175_2504 [Leptospira santarosai str. HAI821]|uniref:Uncharacterized protein n=1 Tax=Leptospira santarosai str. ZUN179 TaxID=1049985 RepID=M6UU20_9LEPT|nr:hypothetical protein LEP1GSC169_3676 [Leptospira santarosai str. HAI1349]EMO33596.1 hypothetical protein LEP1GSC175_2504 [Leptospira santarosai str. HAI821]EMO46271.1 hypothetical protein LEP1GSC187_3707 [Leptospira santarosai str. ZUN179]
MDRVWKLSETFPELSISLSTSRSMDRVWKLSETLSMDRVSSS